MHPVCIQRCRDSWLARIGFRSHGYILDSHDQTRLSLRRCLQSSSQRFVRTGTEAQGSMAKNVRWYGRGSVTPALLVPLKAPRNRPSLSVVIPTLNEERHTGALLYDVMEQTKKADEVIVVD